MRIISISIRVIFHHNDTISEAFIPQEKSVVFSETSFNLAVCVYEQQQPIVIIDLCYRHFCCLTVSRNQSFSVERASALA